MILENINIEPASLPDFKELRFNRHPRRFLKQQYLVLALFFSVGLIVILAILLINYHLFVLLGLLVWLMLAGTSYFVTYKNFPIRGYAIRERDISYREGWLNYSITIIPFVRVQHVEVIQGPLDRYFTLSGIKIYTAGGSGSDLSIDGLDPEEALRLKEYILGKADSHE